MEIITPKAPFLWFDPRIHEGLSAYEESGPIFHLLRASESVCGVLDGPNEHTVKLLVELLSQENRPRISILLTLYAAGPTGKAHLEALSKLQTESATNASD